MIIFKIVLIVSLIMILYQDIKERKVYWFLFPIVALCAGALLYNNMFPELFYTTIIINMTFIIILLLVIFLYSKLKLKSSISNTFGLGDAFLFFALIFTFSSIPFLTLFVFGLLFSLLMHIVLKKNSKFTTVPLAGYLSLFFTITYIGNWSGLIQSLYSI